MSVRWYILKLMKNKGKFIVVILLILVLIGVFKLVGKKTITNKNEPLDLIQINMAYPALGTTYNGQIGRILEKTDILKNNKLAAKVTPYGTGREMKVAMVAGKEDVMISSESVFLVMVGQGFDAYGISSLGAEGKMALVVPTSSKVNTVKDLKGKKVATIFGTSPHKPAVSWLKEAGLMPGKDVELVNLSSAEAIRAALETKQIDAAVLWDPYVTDGVKNKMYRVIVDTDLDLVTVMSGAYANKNPEAVVRFNNALKEAAAYLTNHKDEIAAEYGQTTKLGVDLVKEVSLKNKNYSATDINAIDISIGQALLEKLKNNEKFLFEEKLITKDFNVSDYIKQ